MLMSEETKKRVISEAALAKRFETEINERASTADIPALIETVEAHSVGGGGSFEPAIALDTDGVPYITIGD